MHNLIANIELPFTAVFDNSLSY